MSSQVSTERHSWRSQSVLHFNSILTQQVMALKTHALTLMRFRLCICVSALRKWCWWEERETIEKGKQINAVVWRKRQWLGYAVQGRRTDWKIYYKKFKEGEALTRPMFPKEHTWNHFPQMISVHRSKTILLSSVQPRCLILGLERTLRILHDGKVCPKKKKKKKQTKIRILKGSFQSIKMSLF